MKKIYFLASIFIVLGMTSLRGKKNPACQASKDLKTGAIALERFKKDFQPGIVQLKKMALQLSDGVEEVNNVLVSLQGVKKKIHEQAGQINKKNLKNMGLSTLDENVKQAFESLLSGMDKINKVLSILKKRLSESSRYVSNNANQVLAQVNKLNNEIKRKRLSKKLEGYSSVLKAICRPKKTLKKAKKKLKKKLKI